MLLPARFDSTYFSENECSEDGWKAMDSMCQSKSDMVDTEKTHSIIAAVRWRENRANERRKEGENVVEITYQSSQPDGCPS